MRRREFITLLGAAAAWPFAVSLGTPALARDPPKIIILHSGFPNRTPIHLLFEALGKLGYENSRTATIDLLGGEGDPNRLNALALRSAPTSTWRAAWWNRPGRLCLYRRPAPRRVTRRAWAAHAREQ